MVLSRMEETISIEQVACEETSVLVVLERQKFYFSTIKGHCILGKCFD